MIELMETLLLSLVGISAGIVVSGAVFAFLSAIGVVERLIAAVGCEQHIMEIETALILGGIWGNTAQLTSFAVPRSGMFLVLYGSFCGMFTGSLIMSLAETIQVIPILCRRLQLKNGLSWMVATIALGKSTGCLIYYLCKIY